MAGDGGHEGPAIRLAIVDDHEVFRMGLRVLLERAGRIVVAWDTGSPHEAWRQIVDQPVDAVVVDINLGGPVDGLEVCRMLTTRDRGVRVVLMSGLVDEQRLAGAPRAGAVGFVPKDLAAGEMVEALVGLVRPPRAGHGPGRLAFRDEQGSRLEALSPRERQVLAEIRLGRTNREIAGRLQVATSTVNKHVHQVLRKLRVRNRAEAAIVAAELVSRPRRPEERRDRHPTPGTFDSRQRWSILTIDASFPSGLDHIAQPRGHHRPRLVRQRTSWILGLSKV